MVQKTMESLATSVRSATTMLAVATLMAVVLIVMSAGPASAGVEDGTNFGGNDKGYGNLDNGRPVDPDPPW
jgi:hypothetical protein